MTDAAAGGACPRAMGGTVVYAVCLPADRVVGRPSHDTMTCPNSAASIGYINAAC
jgi:hypothetical protein